MGNGLACRPRATRWTSAIQGDGFLQVGNGAPGSTAPYTDNLPSTVDYTRAGNFTLNSRAS